MTLYDGYSSPGDPGGGRDATKWYPFDAVSHADQINANTAAIATNAAAIAAIVSGTQAAEVATSQNTGSATFTDLGNTSDTVTVTVGASGIVILFLQALMYNSAGDISYVGVAISGANTQAASGDPGLEYTPVGAGVNNAGQFGTAVVLTGLTAGSTTFKMKYKVASGTSTFGNRRIAVVPFP